MAVWPFGRRGKDEDAEAPVPTETPAAPEPGGDVSPADGPALGVQRAPLGPPAWTRLPTIQRVVADAPLTAPRSRLVEGLSSWKSPATTLAPLGHAVTDDAPVGMVGTTSTAVLDPPTGDPEHPAAPASDAPLPSLDLRVQRAQAPTKGLTRVPSWMDTPAPLTPVQRSVEAPTNMVDAPPQDIPPVTFPTVELIAPPPPPAEAAPAPSATAPLVGEQPAAPPASTPAAPTNVQRSVAPPNAGDLDLPLAPTPTAGHAEAAATTDAPAAEATPEPAAPTVQRSTEAPPPAATEPTGASTETAPLLGGEPTAEPAPPTPPTVSTTVQRHEAGDGHDHGPGEGQDDLPLQQTPAPTVQRRRGLGAPIGQVPPSVDAPPPAQPTTAPPTPVQRATTPAPAASPTAPLVGETPPLGSPASAETPAPSSPPAPGIDLPLVQRSTVEVEPAEATTETAPLLGDAPTPVAAEATEPGANEAPDAGQPETPLPLASSAPPAAAPAAVQRSALDAPAPDEAPAAPVTETAPLIGDAPAPTAAAPSAPVDPAAAEAPAAAAPGADLPLAGPAPTPTTVQRHAMSVADFTAAAASVDPPKEDPVEKAKAPGVVQRSTIGAPAPASASTTTTAPPPSRPASLPIAPLLSGRPFEVSPIQRQKDGTPTPASAMALPSVPGAAQTATTASAHPELSSAPGVYDPELPLALWSGAAPPAEPAGSNPGAEAVAPGDVVSAVQRATGQSIETPRLRRDTLPFVQRMGARALHHEGTAHVPNELGSLDTPANRGLVAHELTHVAQRQALGGAVPPENSSLGLALEGQARAVESAVMAGIAPPRVNPNGASAAPPPAPAPDMPLQRAPSEPSPAPSPFTPDQLSTLLSLASSPPSAGGPAVQRQEVVQREDAPELLTASSTPSAPSPSPAPSGDGDSEQSKKDDELAARLYPRIRTRLRRELRNDRERLGRPTDV